jgi:hypothetical protein
MAAIYEVKHVLFCDILGFSKAVLCQQADPATFLITFDHLRAAVGEANRKIDSDEISQETGLKFDYTITPRAEHFSDSIVVTTPATNVDAIWLCQAAAEIQNMLVRRGFLSRGAICTGPLHHAETSIIGPAFVTAVQREKETSQPRIAVSAETLACFRIANNAQDAEIASVREQQLLASDQSGVTWIDPFHYLKFFANCNEPPPHQHVRADIAAWSKVLKQGLLRNEGKVFKKYVWMSEQYNEKLAQPGSWIQPIEIPPISTNSGLESEQAGNVSIANQDPELS